MDPHYSLQVPNSGGSSRGTSRPVSVQPASSSSQPQSARKRASHTVQSSQQQPHQVPDDNLPTYRDVYSHPAAVAYAAAHPRRTIPKFGPYLLLQTLGEGEFGKVKLGLHMQWGEEVAVKLIRRGNIDTSARMSKVEREIEVLRVRRCPLCHIFSLFGPTENASGRFASTSSFRLSNILTSSDYTTLSKRTSTSVSSSSTRRVVNFSTISLPTAT